VKWRVWIPQDCDPSDSGHRFLEQLQSLGAQVSHHEREPGDVAAGVRKACDQPGADWISDERRDNRDGRRGALECLGCGRSLHDDYIDFPLDQVSSQLRYLVEIAVGRSPLDHQVASLGVTSVA
jgi:hypothetical protein